MEQHREGPNQKMEVAISSPQSLDDDNDDDAVWTPDVEAAFQEALAMFPSCGRRKIVQMNDDGKGTLYGRNELIGKYILDKTGKARNRKQVSSHIQVLARKNKKSGLSASDSPAGSTYSSPALSPRLSRSPNMSRSPNASAIASSFNPPSDMGQLSYHTSGSSLHHSTSFTSAAPIDMQIPSLVLFGANRVVLGRFSVHVHTSPSSAHRLALMDGSHNFVQENIESIKLVQLIDKFPSLVNVTAVSPNVPMYICKLWVDINFLQPPATIDPAYFTSFRYESTTMMNVEVCTQVIVGGQLLAERTLVAAGQEDYGRFVYNYSQVPLCPFVVKFISSVMAHRDNPATYTALELFSVLQIVRDYATKAEIFCVGFMFDICPPGSVPCCNTYKLIL